MTAEHVGEWRVSVSGATLEEVFIGIAHVIADAAGRPTGEASAWERVEVTASDAATLLVDWANELLGRSEIARRAYSDLRNTRVSRNADGSMMVVAEVRGRPVTTWVSPLKAATYHAVSLEPADNAWHASVLFDV